MSVLLKLLLRKSGNIFPFDEGFGLLFWCGADFTEAQLSYLMHLFHCAGIPIFLIGRVVVGIGGTIPCAY